MLRRDAIRPGRLAARQRQFAARVRRDRGSEPPGVGNELKVGAGDTAIRRRKSLDDLPSTIYPAVWPVRLREGI